MDAREYAIEVPLVVTVDDEGLVTYTVDISDIDSEVHAQYVGGVQLMKDLNAIVSSTFCDVTVTETEIIHERVPGQKEDSDG